MLEAALEAVLRESALPAVPERSLCPAAADAGEEVRAHSVAEAEPGALSDAAFVARFMLPNAPALLRGVGREWRMAREWVTVRGPLFPGLINCLIRSLN
jgi:hypothetical protein